MTDFSSGLRSDVEQALKWGTKCCIKYFNPTLVTGSYNDISSLAQSGTDLYFSGLPFPIDGKSATERLAIEQGWIEQDDLKFYCNPITIEGSGTFRIQIGSPTGDNYEVLGKLGIQTQKVSNSPVYHRMFLRKLQIGSLAFEV